MTDWGKNILDSYYEYKYDKCYRKIFSCVCNNPHQKSKFYYPNQYNSELLNFLTEEKRFKKFVATQQNNINNNMSDSNSDMFKDISKQVSDKINVINSFPEKNIDV